MEQTIAHEHIYKLTLCKIHIHKKHTLYASMVCTNIHSTMYPVHTCTAHKHVQTYTVHLIGVYKYTLFKISYNVLGIYMYSSETCTNIHYSSNMYKYI